MVERHFAVYVCDCLTPGLFCCSPGRQNARAMDSPSRIFGEYGWVSSPIALAQISWMLIEIIASQVDGLPITLLELNTLAHVAYALLLYLLWLHKPQNVQLPFIIDTGTCQTCARLFVPESILSTRIQYRLLPMGSRLITSRVRYICGTI